MEDYSIEIRFTPSTSIFSDLDRFQILRDYFSATNSQVKTCESADDATYSDSEGKRTIGLGDFPLILDRSVYAQQGESVSQASEYNNERFEVHSVSQNTGTSIQPTLAQKKDISLEEKQRMIAKINSSYFEPGVLCEVDTYFEELLKKHQSFGPPLALLSDITNHNTDQEHILEGVLHILSNCEYDQINPFGISIAIAAAYNHSPVIQDLLISCFESWDAPDGIDILERLELDLPWLRKYRDEVVAQLKRTEETA